MAAIVRVAIESALPQLDKLYDYLIPEGLIPAVKPGVRVEVPFGRSKKPTPGFAIELSDDSELGNLSEVTKVVSDLPVLSREIYELCKTVATRQAATLHDVLRLAVPVRSVRVEQSFKPHAIEVAAGNVDFEGALSFSESRVALTPIPWMIGDHPGWVRQFVNIAAENLAVGESTLLIVPDFRDQAAVLKLLEEVNLNDHTVHYGGEQTPSQKYLGFLKCLSLPTIVVGSRAAIFAPAKKLGGILMYNDGDSSLVEPASPYLATREIALLRQQQANCQIVFCGQHRSSEVQRLVEIGYLVPIIATEQRPKIAFSETESRIDSLAFQAIRKALDAGESVLIQVASPGVSTALYCRKCSTKFRCKNCQGVLGLDHQHKPRCRWCSSYNLDASCPECASSEFRQGAAGATRTLAELGKTFPQTALIEATGETRVLSLMPGKRIVVATVGAEPIVSQGYACVVLLDASKLLAKDTLRASENAVRQWADAVSLLRPAGQAVLVGVPGVLGQQFSLWNLTELARTELMQRRELGFPPALRMASITAESGLAEKMVSQLAAQPGLSGIQVLGPQISLEMHRYLIKYDYSVGLTLAAELRARAFGVSVGLVRQSKSTGRNSRAVKVKMDDAEVI